VVPQHLKDNPALTLKLSSLFQGKTTYDDNSITAFLKFSGDYFECSIPWKKIWGMTSNKEENTIWPEDLPRELVFQFAKAKVKELGGKLFPARKSTEGEDLEEQPQGEEPSQGKPTQNEKQPLHVAPEEEHKGPR